MATVVSGTWYFGYGQEFDEGRLKALPPGSYYTEPPDERHFAKTGDTPVVLHITGFGPTCQRLPSGFCILPRRKCLPEPSGQASPLKHLRSVTMVGFAGNSNPARSLSYGHTLMVRRLYMRLNLLCQD